MKGRLPLFVLLAGALTFLTSLYLPWREMQAPHLSGGSEQGFLQLVSHGSVDGWVAGAGDVAVLLVVAIVLATIAALRHPRLAARLPIGSLGVALGYFAAAVAMEVHRFSQLVGGGFTGHPQAPHTTWAYGFYLGLASGAIAALSGLAFRWRGLPRQRWAADTAAVALGIALLISFLLPWVSEGGLYSTAGIEIPAAAIAALALIVGAPWVLSEEGRRWRLPLALVTAILTAAAASAAPFSGAQRYGTWIGVGCAVLLVALEAVRAWPLRLPALPFGPAAIEMGSAAVLLVALFMPWQELFFAGHSPGANGWYVVTGAAAGGLSLALLSTSALPALGSYVLDAAVAVALFVSALGTVFREDLPLLHFGYGAFVGFAAAGVLLVTALVRFRPGRVERRRVLARAVPLAASVLCVAAVVLPMWFVLPQDWTFQATPLYYGWLSVAGLLLALYLVRLWALRIGSAARTGNRLTLVPLTLLTLAALELIRFRDDNVIWGAVILVGLCLLLALFGWIEEDSGLDDVRVPEEIWRVDRLPEPES